MMWHPLLTQTKANSQILRSTRPIEKVNVIMSNFGS
ncbi:MAG: hypothetical protein CM15mP113_3290 [Pseudomonadota bacterium]|nr:MAG: hypothetical protein CM15mP113_3290 [Pseudomonadota bacterium]